MRRYVIDFNFSSVQVEEEMHVSANVKKDNRKNQKICEIWKEVEENQKSN